MEVWKGMMKKKIYRGGSVVLNRSTGSDDKTELLHFNLLRIVKSLFIKGSIKASRSGATNIYGTDVSPGGNAPIDHMLIACYLSTSGSRGTLASQQQQ